MGKTVLLKRNMSGEICTIKEEREWGKTVLLKRNVSGENCTIKEEREWGKLYY